MNHPCVDPSGRTSHVLGASLAALGIVFGDIGTSPLYAFRECFSGTGAVPMTVENLVGASSLIVWALLLVVSVKYLFIILRLDNRGEGGILALAALIRGAVTRATEARCRNILLLGLAGAALIYADGMLTPAISVLSAVEGLAVSAPVVAHLAVPAAVAILAGLFAIQQFGTGKVGRLFGPVVLVWFVVLAGLGLSALAQRPQVLLALGPHEALMFLGHEWRHSLPLLAAVFLAVTGGEALYADLGHFGIRPIRVSWFSLVLPALLLNYLGQAALLGSDPAAIRSPFFLMAPAVVRFPLTLLATAAAIIASQALISGAFSLTTQAIQLGCLPRVRVLHTSDHAVGQVYVPAVNRMLAVSCMVLVLAFKTSANLAGAYGIAISLTMTITSVLFFFAARAVWGWSRAGAGLLAMAFLTVDGVFLAANSQKILQGGGWVPLVVAAGVMGVMLVWIWGRNRLQARLTADALPVEDLLRSVRREKIHRVPGTAVFMTGSQRGLPTALLHNLKHNQVLHEQVLLLHVVTLDRPRASAGERVAARDLGSGVHHITLHFGFAETPDVPAALRDALPEAVRFDPGRTTYFLGSETYRIGPHAALVDRLRLPLFAALVRNAAPATAYFQLPPGRVVELGAQVVL